MLSLMSDPASDSQVKLFGVYVWMIAASRMRVASAAAELA
jgi:hypothetical protein